MKEIRIYIKDKETGVEKEEILEVDPQALSEIAVTIALKVPYTIDQKEKDMMEIARVLAGIRNKKV